MAASRYSVGFHAVDKLLTHQRDKLQKLYIDERSKNPRLHALREKARELGVPTQGARSHRLDDMAQGSVHQGVVAALTNLPNIDEAALRGLVEQALADGQTPLLLLLDGVQDPHNLGACLRSADAAGALAVVAPRKASVGVTPATRKVASGAAEVVPLVQVASLARVLDWLAEYGVARVGTTDAATQALWECDLTGAVAIVMGTEATGLGPEVMQRCDTLVALPMRGVVESLNVSVATGICLFERVRQTSK
ncbi:MAG: 23S rRNA (guanosine(2251)-2'-O)-methyltransferase RlmB [Pseudomonadota bacterium]